MEPFVSHPLTEPVVRAFCVSCHCIQRMCGATEAVNRRAGRDLTGYCSACGRPMYRPGGWTSVCRPDEEPKGDGGT
jgi:hypothetical protein